MVVRKQPTVDTAGRHLFHASLKTCINAIESGRELVSGYNAKSSVLFDELVERGEQVQLDAQTRAKQLGKIPRSKLEEQLQRMPACFAVLKDAFSRPAKAASKA